MVDSPTNRPVRLEWAAGTRKQMKSMPDEIQDVFGSALLDVEYGDVPEGARPYGEGLPKEITKLVETRQASLSGGQGALHQDVPRRQGNKAAVALLTIGVGKCQQRSIAGAAAESRPRHQHRSQPSMTLRLRPAPEMYSRTWAYQMLTNGSRKQNWLASFAIWSVSELRTGRPKGSWRELLELLHRISLT